MPIVALGALTAAGSLGGAAIAASGAGKAASTQSNAALQAAQIQAGSAQQALNFQKQQYATSQQELAPWLQSGQSALSNLNYLMGIGPNPGATGQGPNPQPTAPLQLGSPNAMAQGGNLQNNQNPMPPASGPVPVGGNQSFGGLTGNQSPLPPTSGPIQLGQGQAPTAPLQQTPGARAQGNQLTPSGGTNTPGTMPQGYGGQTFAGLTGSSDPNVSPNQQTTQQWKAQGIPFQNITTTDGRTVAVRTDQGGGPQQSLAPPQGIQQSSAAQINPNLGAYGSLSQGWGQTFQPPTGVTEQNDPGFKFRLQQGEQALQQSAAAKGGLLTGGTARDLSDYGQQSASNEYENVYNRAFNTYGMNYNTFTGDQANKYNRFASLAGIGQQTAGQLGMIGQNSANNSGQIALQSGNAQASGINNAAAASASGYQNAGNIYGSAVGGLTGNLANLYGYLYNQQHAGGGPQATGTG